jgi:hypothetical protein
LKAQLGRLERGESAGPETRARLEQLTLAIQNRLLAIYRTGDLAAPAQVSPSASAATKSAAV